MNPFKPQPIVFHEPPLFCHHCGHTVLRSEAFVDEGFVLCNDCYRAHYHPCTECGRLIHEVHLYYIDDEVCCYSCYNRRLEDQKALHEYSYKPEPIFYGDGQRFLGVELEIDDAGRSEDNAESILYVANRDAKHMYINVAVFLSDEEMLRLQWDEFVERLDKVRHAELLNYLSLRGLTEMEGMACAVCSE